MLTLWSLKFDKTFLSFVLPSECGSHHDLYIVFLIRLERLVFFLKSKLRFMLVFSNFIKLILSFLVK